MPPDDLFTRPSLSDESTIIDPQARIAELVNHTPPGGIGSIDEKASPDPPTIIEDDAYSLARKQPAPTSRPQPRRQWPHSVSATPAEAKPGEPVRIGTAEYIVLGAKAAKRLAVQPAPASVSGGFVAIDLWAENQAATTSTIDMSS